MKNISLFHCTKSSEWDLFKRQRIFYITALGFLNENEGSTSRIFPHKGLKGRDQADLKATAEGDEIKKEEASAARAHINAALWAPPETNERRPQSERGRN